MPSSAPTDDFIEFYAMADYPYVAREVRKLPKHLADIPADAPFIFHLGDTNDPSTTNCTEDTFITTRDLLATAKSPVFLTPGENDWNACPYPDQALSHWRQYFERLEEVWNHTISVKRQVPKRPENIAFFMDFVLFVSVNIVGEPLSSPAEWKDILTDDFDWVASAMFEHREKMSAVVIFGHAPPDMYNSEFFGPIVEAASFYRVPILYVHGHGHTFETKSSIYSSPYVSTLQLDRGGKGPPLKIRVNNRAETPFQYDRRVSRVETLETLSDDYLDISQAKYGLTVEQVKQGYTVDHAKAGISFEEYVNGFPSAEPSAAPQVAQAVTSSPTMVPSAAPQVSQVVTDEPTEVTQATTADSSSPTAAPQVSQVITDEPTEVTQVTNAPSEATQATTVGSSAPTVAAQVSQGLTDKPTKVTQVTNAPSEVTQATTVGSSAPTVAPQVTVALTDSPTPQPDDGVVFKPSYNGTEDVP